MRQLIYRNWIPVFRPFDGSDFDIITTGITQTPHTHQSFDYSCPHAGGAVSWKLISANRLVGTTEFCFDPSASPFDARVSISEGGILTVTVDCEAGSLAASLLDKFEAEASSLYASIRDAVHDHIFSHRMNFLPATEYYDRVLAPSDRYVAARISERFSRDIKALYRDHAVRKELLIDDARDRVGAVARSGFLRNINPFNLDYISRSRWLWIPSALVSVALVMLTSLCTYSIAVSSELILRWDLARPRSVWLLQENVTPKAVEWHDTQLFGAAMVLVISFVVGIVIWGLFGFKCLKLPSILTIPRTFLDTRLNVSHMRLGMTQCFGAEVYFEAFRDLNQPVGGAGRNRGYESAHAAVVGTNDDYANLVGDFPAQATGAILAFTAIGAAIAATWPGHQEAGIGVAAALLLIAFYRLLKRAARYMEAALGQLDGRRAIDLSSSQAEE